MRPSISCCVPFLLVWATAPAQQEELTLERVLSAGPLLAPPPPQVLWVPGGHLGSYTVTDSRGNQAMYMLQADRGPIPGATAALALAALGQKPKGALDRFPPCSWQQQGTLRFELDDRVVTWAGRRRKVETLLEWPASESDPLLADSSLHSTAPGDARVAYVRGHQLWIGERDKTTQQLTNDGSPDIVYGAAAHRAEFGITSGLFWSPDARWLAFSREDMRPIAAYPYQDLNAEPPAPGHGRYPMAGRVHSRVTIGVCDTTTGGVRYLEHVPLTDDYWTNVAVTNAGKVFVTRVNRGQDSLELVRYDAASGKPERVLLREQDREWIEPEHPPTFLDDGSFLWWSSRDGHRHLWLYTKDGGPRHQVTKGDFDVQILLGVDAEHVWFQAAGADPRQLHLFRAPLAGGDVEQLTRGRGTHSASLSPDKQRAFITHSSLEQPPRCYILDLGPDEIEQLPPIHDPLADTRLPLQQFFEVTASDGTTLYGHVAIPPNRRDGERCPVLLYVYGGPHAQLVTDRWLGGAPLWLQALAAEGYVVCRLDNRGTPNRGIEFEQAVFRRLGMLEVDDQLRAVAWLGQQPFVDSARIAVHGWSYGGYMTLRLLLLAPDKFACGISGAPVTDWRMYETGYTERYMDTPAENANGYDDASVLPLAGRLQDPLLLVHGTDDRTVMWAQTLRFVDRCIDAGKDLTYFPYPMQKHGLVGRDRAHFLRLLRAFLHRNLGAPAK